LTAIYFLENDELAKDSDDDDEEDGGDEDVDDLRAECLSKVCTVQFRD